MTRWLMVVLALALAGAAGAQNVKITPLGTHAGELCDRDRATIFEDPTGERILYDAGASVTGADDPRLGTVHVVLLSHAHRDHMGDQRVKGQGAGTCARPELVSAAPHSTTAVDRGGEERGDRDDERHGGVHRAQGRERARQAGRGVPADWGRDHGAGGVPLPIQHAPRRPVRRAGSERRAGRGDHDRCSRPMRTMCRGRCCTRRSGPRSGRM